MYGFEGPFQFDVDDEGTIVPFDQLSETVKSAIKNDPEITRTNSKVYRFRIGVSPATRPIEKHHDWANVSRLLVETRVGSRRMKIVGLYPRDEKVGHISQHDLDFVTTLKGDVNLFEVAKFKVNLSNALSQVVKSLATENKYGILSYFTDKVAKWVFSRGYKSISFELYLYLVVPNEITENQRQIYVNIVPLRQKNKQITQASLWDHQVKLA
jgi:hypothetical protein